MYDTHPMHPAAGHPSILVPLLVGALIIWRFYARIRRMVMRQKLSNVRPWITVCAFPLLILLFAINSVAHPVGLAALGGGLVAGIGLGIYGLRLTRFENTPQGLFYTPSAHLGIGLSALLILRVGYRLFQVYSLPNPGDAPPPVPFTGTPTTLLIFGALAAYYVAYAIGLIRWRRSVLNSPQTATSVPPV
jgi:hypothetical protein